MEPIVWILLLLAVAAFLLVLELFITSGGILAFLACTAILLDIALVYINYGPLWGSVFLIVMALILPAVISQMLKWWPHTAMGKRILNLPDTPDAELPLPTDELKALVDRRGRAKRDMLPHGLVEIDGAAYDAVTDGSMIDAGAEVEVLRVEGTYIVVHAVVDRESTPAADVKVPDTAPSLEEIGVDPSFLDEEERRYHDDAQ